MPGAIWFLKEFLYFLKNGLKIKFPFPSCGWRPRSLSWPLLQSELMRHGKSALQNKNLRSGKNEKIFYNFCFLSICSSAFWILVLPPSTSTFFETTT